MLQFDELSAFDQCEDPADLLRALPEIRHNLELVPRTDELGLRSLLDWPEASAPSRLHSPAARVRAFKRKLRRAPLRAA
jgi:hypothetical protein